MMKIARLGIKQYKELKRLSELKDFPFKINRRTVLKTCHGKAFQRMCKSNTIHNKIEQMYGCFDGDSLVGVVCAKFEFVSPVGSNEPMHRWGWNCELTGAYTVLGYRKHGICTALTSAVKDDAQTIGANIFCPILADDKECFLY